MDRPEVLILRELLETDNGFVSGARLARQMRMSRVAVWGYMEKLRRQGFEFEAVRRRGYRLANTPRALHPALLEAFLHRRKPAGLVLLDSVDSTNSEAERRLAAGAEVPLVIIAREQTAGRGRFGRVWHSAANGNLYASFVFRPRLIPARMQTFTLWMGLNVCEMIASFCRIEPRIKWPNDLVHDGRKIGGMLTEARMDADQIRDLIFGLGLNISSESLPPELIGRAAALADITARPIDVNRLAAALIGRVLQAYEEFTTPAKSAKFRKLWEKYDLLKGRKVDLSQGSDRLTGTASGINDEGALLLRLENGTIRAFQAGEVTLSGKQL